MELFLPARPSSSLQMTRIVDWSQAALMRLFIPLVADQRDSRQQAMLIAKAKEGVMISRRW